MNSLLFKAIRLSAKRQIPAVAKQRAARPNREKVFKYLRILTPLTEIPLQLPKEKRFYLDGPVGLNTKTGAAFEELTENGIDENLIWHRSLAKKNQVTRLLRITLRLPWVLGLIAQKWKVFRQLDLLGLEVSVGYSAYKAFFKGYSKLIPVIISDISPLLHMQWAGALAAGSRVMWWQDDYHHFKGFSTENYLPYKCHYAAVLNEFGFQTAKEKCTIERLFKRKETLVKLLSPIPENPRVGFASNVLFQADEKQVKYIDKIRQKLGTTHVYCRLHPNSKLHGRTDQPNWLSFAPKEETLKEFAEEVDLVIVGNSAVQLKLLCLGVPVVHVEGFDGFGFDLYKYCELGFSYGAKNLKGLDIGGIRIFYSDHSIASKLDNYVNVTTDIPSLEELPKYIKRCIN